MSDAYLWGETERMVHRKIDHQDGASDASLKAVIEQLSADRTAITQLHGAIQAVARVVNNHNEGMCGLYGRMEEQTRMRLDDHRLHMATVTHIGTAVEDVGREQIRLAEHTDAQDKEIFDEPGLELQLQS